MRVTVILLAAGLLLAASAEPLTASLDSASGSRSAHVVARNLDEDAPAAYAGPAFSGSAADSGDTSDGQTRIKNTLQVPFISIGQIRVTNNDDDRLCSGALISTNPPVVLSAGHCWWNNDADDGGNVDVATVFVPAYDPNGQRPAPFGAANITGAKVPTQFVQCGDDYSSCASYDVSLLFLDGPATTGNTLPYGYLDQLNGVPETLYTAGYPSGKCLDRDNNDYACPMYYTSCPGSAFDDTQATGTLSCNSYKKGQSGAPLWAQPNGGDLVVIGVVTTGDAGDDDGESNLQYTAITQSLYNNLQQWIQDGLNIQSNGATTYLARNLDTLSADNDLVESEVADNLLVIPGSNSNSNSNSNDNSDDEEDDD